MTVGPLWSQNVPANGVAEVEPDCDVQITNIALETVNPGRTVVKLHYIQRDVYGEDSDSDSELDDDEGEEGEESDLDDRLPKGEDVTVVLCSLYPEKVEQVSINVLLVEDDAYEIIVEGPNSVHMLGNYVFQPAEPLPHDDYPYSDSDIDSELADEEGGLYDPETGLPIEYETDDDEDDSMSDDSDDLEEEASARFAEIGDMSPPKANGILPHLDASSEDDDSSEGEMELDAAAAVDGAKSAPAVSVAPVLNGESTAGLSKNQRKKLKKQQAAAQAAATQGLVQAVTGKKEETMTITKDGKKVDEIKSTAQVTVKGNDGKDVKATAKKQSKKTTLPNGVVVEDIKMGDGPAAKAGQKVSLRYIGKLKDGKVFDSNTKGKPFSFKLGGGQVIKGWETGLEGMRPGGERRLTIPPSQAYGKAGTDGIPSNSVLTFEVKLLSIA